MIYSGITHTSPNEINGHIKDTDKVKERVIYSLVEPLQ
jgi:hypothetical protein